MVTRYLIDSSIANKYLNGSLPEEGFNFLDTVFEVESIISVITKIELLRWVTDNREQYHKVEIFVEDSTVLDLTDEIVNKTIELRQKYKQKTPDAIIAATALVHKLVILTDNEKDFNNIKGLKVLNPNRL
jgi:predicted nucleic acid-binding protein